MKKLLLLLFILLSFIGYSQNNPQWMIYNTSNSNLPSNWIRDVVIDNLNRKWISISQHGLLRIDGDNWTYFNTNNSEIPSNNLHTINVDSENRFWGVSYGVFKLGRFDGNEWSIWDNSNTQIPEQNVKSLVFDSQNHLWFLCGNDNYFTGTNYIFELENDSTLLLKSSFNTSKGHRMMEFDNDGLLKIGDWFGIYFFENDSLQYYQAQGGSLGSYVTDIKRDSSGMIWMATGLAGWGSLVKFDGTTFTEFFEYQALALEIDSQGSIWIGTESFYPEFSELIKFDGTNWTVYNPHNSSLPQTDRIEDLAFDRYDNLWIATKDSGIVIFNENGIIIPVDLTTFTSSVSENDVTLNWQTATETNNQGFQIERRETKDERSEEWENIGFVNGKGTTTEPQSYSFADKNLEAGKYQYRLKQIDFDGTFEYSDIIDVEINSPTKFSLEQNYPNPFNPSTKIHYVIPNVVRNLKDFSSQAPRNDNAIVTLKVYDILGKEVATLVNEEKPAGSYEVEFNSVETFHATSLPSGVYFYQLRAGAFVETKKMILLR
jgi:ligand-binding sensor domain-containing protein